MKDSKVLETKYLIVGNSAGGIGAVEAIRDVDKTGSIMIVSDEPYPAYSRPLISEYLAGERTVEQMLFRPADFNEQNGIELLESRKATRLDLNMKTIELAGGECIVWQKLLLATGGKPIIPDIMFRYISVAPKYLFGNKYCMYSSIVPITVIMNKEIG